MTPWLTPWLIPAALVVYCFWAVLLILQSPGLQYDEALLVSGAVHMLNSPGEITLPHDPDTWLCAPGRCFPLMTVRYVGPIKEYLCLPIFALFGAHAAVIRMVAALLALLGIWGIAKLLAEQVGPLVAGAVALVMAINPTYLDLTVFDNDAVAPMMAGLGVLGLAVAAYLRKRTVESALWVGAAIAFGVWARANYALLLAALCGAVILVLRAKLLRVPWAHWGAMAAGGLMAGMPFLVYQLYSHGGTWQGVSMFVSHSSFADRVSTQLIQVSEMLLCDREHRAIWAGPAMPVWQRWLFPAVVLGACCTVLVLRGRNEPLRRWGRIAGAGFLILAAILFLSRLELSEHHLVALLPLAAVVTTLAGAMLAAHSRWGLAVTATVAALYGISALYWQVSAVRGLAITGGVGVWSDGVYGLAEDLHKKYADRDIQILDWGLQNNLYVLTQGRLRSREVWPNATLERNDRQQPWLEEIRKGGVYLMNGPESRQFADPSTGFLRAIADGAPSVQRYPFAQRDHKMYAEIVEVEPNTVHGVDNALATPEAMGGRVMMSDPRFGSRLSGFYRIEDNGWRWTQREFSITLNAPRTRTAAGLTLQLYLPDAVVQKLGSMELRAKVNEHVLAPETYREGGEHEFKRDLRAEWLRPGANQFHFSLDKYLPPSAADDRELGVIVKSASLDQK